MAQDPREKEKEEILSYIKTWEDKKKAKVDNKADRRLAVNDENSNKNEIELEAEEKTIETETEQQRQKKIEKLKNKRASSAKKIEDKKVKIDVDRNKGHHHFENRAEKYRSSKPMPTRPTKCFGMCSDE